MDAMATFYFWKLMASSRQIIRLNKRSDLWFWIDVWLRAQTATPACAFTSGYGQSWPVVYAKAKISSNSSPNHSKRTTQTRSHHQFCQHNCEGLPIVFCNLAHWKLNIERYRLIVFVKISTLVIFRNRCIPFPPCFAICPIVLHYIFRLGRPTVNMMQSAKDWFAYNLANFLNLPVFWWILIKRYMRSADIVILEDVFVQNIVQMFFVENDHMVKTLSTKRANDSFAERILPWASWCSWRIFQSDRIGCAFVLLADIINSRHMVIFVDPISMAIIIQCIAPIPFVAFTGNSPQSFISVTGQIDRPMHI